MTTLTHALGIRFPIIQAPMAGSAATPELVAAVANVGGLGSLGAGYLSPSDIRTAILRLRELTHQPFSVNLFIPEKHHATPHEINEMSHWIEQSCPELNINIHTATPPYAPLFEEQMSVILEEKVPVFSFTFGVLDDKWIEKLKNQGVFLIGTATSLAEARLLAEHEVDAVVAQGSEAGGHRGTFIGKAEEALVGVKQLVKELVDAINIPIIAAGGIMDAKGIMEALQAGCAAVQMGTAFLSCKECGIHAKYKEALLNAKQDNTTLTRVFSGKMARGIKNKFIERMNTYQDSILDYPIQNALTRSMRKEADKQGNSDFMSLWAGQSLYLCKDCSVAELMKELTAQLT